MARRLKKRGAASIEATRHTGDRRSNIPTAELEGFTEDAEKAPKEVLYPRDSSLDPQLVWKGKDEQDQQDLAVPAVPVYIQEKISPQALVEDLRRESNVAPDTEQINLFSDFNGLPFERLVEFYEHDQQWTNRMILGDSLLAMTSLAEKEGLRGKVQMIYIDPPYGVKFGSNWQVSTRKREVRDGKAEDATRQPEQIKAFRDTWDLGIHSYLTYLRDRFATASDLLSESGSIFVQIGDENVHLVRSLMDEIFGSDNFCLSIAYKKTTGAGSPAVRTDLPPAVFDYLLWYAKDRQTMKYRQLFDSKVQGGEGTGQYRWIETESGRRPASAAELIAPNARLFRYDNLTSQTAGQTTVFPVDFAGQTFVPAKGGWKTNAAGMANLRAAGRLLAAGQTLCYLRYLDDFPARPRSNLWDDTVTSGFGEPKVFVVQTHPRVLERCILMTTDPGDLVLDPTCGSGTTAYVAEQWGRRWITLDTSRVAVALARTRLMTARYPYYLLADSDAGVLKEAERAGQPVPSPMPNSTGDVKKGFLYERVPHVTLKSIANNPEIEDDMAPDEIDAAITRHAESELLYDKPAVAPGTVRVSGPFTVESLSPHRLMPAADDGEAAQLDPDAGEFVDRILDNLRKAGVQNTVKAERLTFDRIEPWPGEYVNALGDYAEGDKSRRAAISIGPEHSTVGTEFVREAAKEAIQVADVLVVCGFAFEALVGDETAKLGRLTILKARMNPDLAMGDELLKKTGAGNLFMVFGEPDIEIQARDGDQLTVEIRGLDVYDPTTGAVRSHSTDDIACWFVDTAYDGNSFFVRQAYFLGADEPYEKLRKTLRTEIDEAAWASIYSTTSRPFARPTTGKIAVKVINHYGDEVLKVYPV